MKILHLLYAGGTGGIEKLCKDIGIYSEDENHFVFTHEGGAICEQMCQKKLCVSVWGYNNKDVLKVYNTILKIISKEKYDCIVVHQAPLNWIPMLLYLRKKNRAKVVVYVHNDYIQYAKKIKNKIIFDCILKKCDSIIAISGYVKNTVLRGVPSIDNEKIQVIYNGVSNNDYNIDRSKTFENPVKLIYVGRLIKEKGVQVLIEALSLVEEKNDFQLKIIGDGSYRCELERLTHELGLENNVTFCGMQRKISDYLAASDVFVHPAIWNEGFGITIIEAMSSGLICIAFDKGAIPEIIENKKSGFIVQQCSAEMLAKTLDEVKKKLKEDNLIYMRKDAKNRAKMFSIKAVVEQLHQLYERLSLE